MQTLWYRTDEQWLRLTQFFGTLFLINFAIGAATGLVQEFQFGMNWSAYSKYVGDVFGAPLAIEGLAAFMLESTFLGLWIFGCDRLSPQACTSRPSVVSARHLALGLLHHRRELVDAAPGRLQDRQANGRAELTTSGRSCSSGSRSVAFGHDDPRRADGRRLSWSRRRRAGTSCAAATSSCFRPAAKLALIVARSGRRSSTSGSGSDSGSSSPNCSR